MPPFTSRFDPIALFDDLSPAALQVLDDAAQAVWKQDGQIVMLEGERSTHVYFIIEGGARVYRTNADGREQTLIQLRTGDAFNIPTVFTVDRLAPASVAAVGTVHLLRIPVNKFHHITTHTPEIATAVLHDLSHKLVHFTNLTHDLSLRSVRARLAQFLLAEFGPDVVAPRQWTQEAIAAEIGTVREVVNRTMRKLAKEGLLTIEANVVTVLDVDTLVDLAAS